MGTLYLAAAAAAQGLPEAAAKRSGSSPITLFVIVILFGLVYFVVLRPQRARQRRAAQTQTQVVPGQKVRTTAGMYGTVVSGDDRDVVIEIAPGVQVRMLRRSIMEVIPDEAAEPDTGTAEHGDSKDTPPDDWDFKDKKA
jgi:preprotein translocase subunit YajC